MEKFLVVAKSLLSIKRVKSLKKSEKERRLRTENKAYKNLVLTEQNDRAIFWMLVKQTLLGIPEKE